MVVPDFLKSGDKTCIISPAGRIDPIKIDNAASVIKSWGFEVTIGKHSKNKYRQFSGTDKQRLSDIQSMIDNPEIKAIFCARGGYGTAKIIDKINWDSFQRHPKWIIGFSDITVLHSYIQNICKSQSIHATMPVNYPDNVSNNESTVSLRKLLHGETPKYNIDYHPLNRHGKAVGKLIGGNLSILYSLRGTKLDIETNDKILFIEDIGEYHYHIDRIMQNFRLGGLFNNLKGLMIGGMNDMKDNDVPYGSSVNEIIKEAVSAYSFPVCFGFPSGHIEPNKAFILGADTILNIDSSGSFFSQTLS